MGVKATTATTATTEEMSISGVLVVVSCRGQEYLSGAKKLYLDKKIRERFSEKPTEEQVLF